MLTMYNMMYKETVVDRMVRKQIYIQAKQNEFLKRKAKELGVAEAELIRRGIDEISRGGRFPSVDRTAWAEAKTVILARSRIKAPQTGRAWKRDDLYQERLERRSH